jgi:hypothetical protein
MTPLRAIDRGLGQRAGRPGSCRWLRFSTSRWPRIGFVLVARSAEIEMAGRVGLGSFFRDGSREGWVRFFQRGGRLVGLGSFFPGRVARGFALSLMSLRLLMDMWRVLLDLESQI